jgi:hypothetical protein
MKKISKIVDVVDNWGGTEEYNTTETIRIYLDDPDYWSDDALVYFEENGVKGRCSIDDILNQEVLVGDEIYLLEE